MIKTVYLHAPEEVDEEVKRIRPQLEQLIKDGAVRPWPNCFENDLRVEAYNRLIDKKFGAQNG